MNPEELRNARRIVRAENPLRAERDALVENLLEYGRHLEQCASETRGDAPCDCGWDQVRIQHAVG